MEPNKCIAAVSFKQQLWILARCQDPEPPTCCACCDLSGDCVSITRAATQGQQRIRQTLPSSAHWMEITGWKLEMLPGSTFDRFAQVKLSAAFYQTDITILACHFTVLVLFAKWCANCAFAEMALLDYMVCKFQKCKAALLLRAFYISAKVLLRRRLHLSFL